MKKFLTALFLVAFTGFGFAIAQDDFDEDWDSEGFSGWDFDNEFSLETKSPTLTFTGVYAAPSIDEDYFTSGEFAPVSGGELKIGFTEKSSKVFKNTSIIELEQTFITLGMQDTEMLEADDEDYKIESWGFGLGMRQGYGYKISDKTDLSFFSGNRVGWIHSNFANKDDLTAADDLHNLDIINTYDDALRFTDGFEGGVSVTLYSPISLDFAYEGTIVYPRHMFWYWMWSGLLEEAGGGLAGLFTDAVMEISPWAAPVIDAVLQNGIGFLFFKMRQQDMNWPIKTIAPLSYESYKVGLSFQF